MKYKFVHINSIAFFNALLIIGLLSTSCNKSEPELFTITIGAFSQDSIGNYLATGNELIFKSEGDCQTWSRNANNDSHDTQTHLHYNAADNVSYDSNTSTFNWTEFGPELNQAAIEATCATGIGGFSKSVNASSYYQDKPNVYLKIINVE